MRKALFWAMMIFLFSSGVVFAKDAISIKAERMEALETKNQVIFTGNVEVKKKDFTLYADKLLVFYQEKNGKREVEKLEAFGRVKIKRGNLIAFAKKATYLKAKEELILEGDPVVWEGDNSVKGARIILYFAEDRYIAESSPEAPAEAIIFAE